MPRVYGGSPGAPSRVRRIPTGEVLRCVRRADLDARVGVSLVAGHAAQVTAGLNPTPSPVSEHNGADTMTLTATVGREAELDSIRAFIDAVPRGPSALTISGEAGIGKTILWEAGVEAARDEGFRVLMCRGVETEASLSFAALSDLLGPVFDDIAPALAGATPARVGSSSAARGARRRNTGPARDRACSVGRPPSAQLFGSVRSRARRHPVARTRPPPALYRSHSDVSPPNRSLCWQRSDTRPGLAIPIDLDRSFDADRLTKVDVGPLDLAAFDRLLRERVGLDLTRPELVRLQSVTHGNPFFALEVGREMARSGTRPTEDRVVQVPETLSAALAERLARLPAETAEVLLKTAALARPTVEVVVARARRPRSSAALVRCRGGGRLGHARRRAGATSPTRSTRPSATSKPRSRSAALCTEASRVAVGDPEERATPPRVGSRGSERGDRGTARRGRRRGRGRGAPAVGASLLELAADLTPDDLRLVRRRRLRAAVLHRVSGSTPRAIAILEALRDAAEPARNGRTCSLSSQGATSEPPRCRCRCATTHSSRPPATTGDRHDSSPTGACSHLTQGRRPRPRSRTGGPPSSSPSGSRTRTSSRSRSHTSRMRKPAPSRRHDCCSTAASGSNAPTTSRSEFLDSPRRALARQQMRMGEVEQARALLEELASEASARGGREHPRVLLWVLVLVEWLEGDGPEALDLAGEAAVAGEQSQAVDHRWLIVRKALVEADLGLVDDARASARYALSGTDAEADSLRRDRDGGGARANRADARQRPRGRRPSA